VNGVSGDAVDEGEIAALLLLFGVAREVEAGDLEAVEEKAGAAGGEGVGGDAAEDGGKSKLDGGALVEGGGEIEGGLARVFEGLARSWARSWAAGGVVVVAEVLVGGFGGAGVLVLGEQGGAAAAVAVGEDVAAVEAFGCDGPVVAHGFVPPPG
jgi:hypothetical protein